MENTLENTQKTIDWHLVVYGGQKANGRKIVGGAVLPIKKDYISFGSTPSGLFGKKTFDSIEISKVTKNTKNTLCTLCQRSKGENRDTHCGKENCEKFEYRPTINQLCWSCKKTCKQWAHVTVSICPNYQKVESIFKNA